MQGAARRIYNRIAVSSIPAPPTGYAARGAQNLALNCLRVKRGERVSVLTWRADDVFEEVAHALVEAGAIVDRFDLESLAGEPTQSKLYAAVSPSMRNATASALLSSYGLTSSLSRAVLLVAERARTRHLHVVGCDLRVLGQSVRADPDVIAKMNARLMERLKAPSKVRVSCANGTALEVTLAAQYPLLAATGRPEPGRPENLPTGVVYTHPAVVSGTFVADRAVVGEGVRTATAALRRAPVRVTFVLGRVADVSCDDRTTVEAIERYLASHADAGRVGLVVWPTNYLVRSEIGVEVQDALLPGMNLDLGFSLSEFTRAPHDAPVQLRLQARRLDVEVDGDAIVIGGRFAPDLMDRIDPLG
jgi:leucyl aminopeptidase (aminopeptidase T)